MTDITFGLMESNTQEFMQVSDFAGNGDKRLSLSGQKRFEVDNLVPIIRFLWATNPLGGYYSDSQGFDPNEFCPVAYLKDIEGFKKSEDIKLVELPNIVACRRAHARTLAKTPDIILKRYFDKDVLTDIRQRDAEVYGVIPKNGAEITVGDTLYFGSYETVLAEVLQVSEFPEDWPMMNDDFDFDREDWKFVLVDKNPNLANEKCQLKDIQPLAPIIGM